MQTVPLIDIKAVFAYVNEAGHIIAKYAKDNSLSSEEAQLRFIECLRFLCLCAARGQSGPYAPSATIDGAWHAFILHTKDYEEFCNKYFSGKYIHHRPTNKPELEAYNNTLKAFDAEYNGYNNTYWPKSLAADCDSGSCQNYCSDGGS